MRNLELMWEQMWRGTINYGRKGLPIQAISAVDLALWDALGKQLGQPVYQLLGATDGRSGERGGAHPVPFEAPFAGWSLSCATLCRGACSARSAARPACQA